MIQLTTLIDKACYCFVIGFYKSYFFRCALSLILYRGSTSLIPEERGEIENMSLSICADRKDVEGNYAISMATSYFERGRATRDKKKKEGRR